MKISTSKYALQIIVMISAVGAAFSSNKFIAVTTWISGQTTAPGNPTTCSTLGNICESQGAAYTCRLSVQLATGTVQDTKGFANNVCTTPRLGGPTYNVITKSNLVAVAPY